MERPEAIESLTRRLTGWRADFEGPVLVTGAGVEVLAREGKISADF